MDSVLEGTLIFEEDVRDVEEELVLCEYDFAC